MIHRSRLSPFYFALVLALLCAPLGAAQPQTAPQTAPAAALISPEQAILTATTDLLATPGGLRLSQPGFSAEFGPQGLAFTPQGSRQPWRWQFAGASSGGQPLAGVQAGAVTPQPDGALAVAYRRGALVEQYLARQGKIEQQFVIPAALPLGGQDLVIAGQVRFDGQFSANERGWTWRSAETAVALGQVRVFDAAGRDLPAQMVVEANATRITVDGAALAAAAYPVTVDPEIGPDDFQISNMGSQPGYKAYSPAVAYSDTHNEFLVAWSGSDNTGSLNSNEFEIYVQLVDAASGAALAPNDRRISSMGPDGSSAYGAFRPAVAYNNTRDEYLVVWYGDDNTAPLVDNEYEIFGQLLDGYGNLIGTDDFRISDMGPDGNVNFQAFDPTVAYNEQVNDYLVAWRGDDSTNNEFEIYGQRLEGDNGSDLGANDFAISDMGPAGSTLYNAEAPQAAWNSTDDLWLVVWAADDNSAPLVDGEMEIFGQLLTNAGAESGGNDFRISSMGPDGSNQYFAGTPRLAYGSVNNRFLVTWVGTDNTAPLVFDEAEIFGQLLNALTGAEVGPDDFRISSAGPNGDTSYFVNNGGVAYAPASNEFLVTWFGNDTSTLAPEEDEVYAQRINAATGAEVGTDDFRISSLGPDGDGEYGVIGGASLAYSPTSSVYLVLFSGNHHEGGLVYDDIEIFGQRLTAAGAETGPDDFMLSDMGADPYMFADQSAVAYNSSANEFLVVWVSSDNQPGLASNEREIFGQRINAATGAEVGTDDFRISSMGPDGDGNFNAQQPAVVYNSVQNQYLVVWTGDDNSGTLVNNELEIFGQRLSALGAEIGTDDFRISDMGPDGSASYVALMPDVTYNATNDVYVVVWGGDDDTAPLVNDEFEIFAQGLRGSDGVEVGANDLRVSDMGPNGSTNFGAGDPAVAWNATDNEYLVVWSGSDSAGALVANENEIFGQRLSNAGAALGSNDFRISSMGPDGNTSYAAYSPALAYNPATNEYLVAWEGDDDSAPQVDNEYEIFGQRLSALGAEVGTDDFRISDMGPDGSTLYQATLPAVSYASTANRYLVVWQGDDNTAPLTDNNNQIFAQELQANGEPTGPNDLRLTGLGPPGGPLKAVDNPAAVFGATNGAFLVVFEGNSGVGEQVAGGAEIYGQLFAPVYEQFIPLVRKD